MIYNQTPFIDFFGDPYLLLSKREDASRSADLTIDYSLERKSVMVNHYDPQVNTDNIEMGEFSDADSALKYIDNIVSGYSQAEDFLPGFSQDLQTYFDHVEGSEILHTYVADGYDCETCGVNDSVLEAYYFPAFSDNENGAASLAVSWLFGCYSGESASGKFDEVKTEVLEILARAVESCEIDSSMTKLKDFISFIESK